MYYNVYFNVYYNEYYNVYWIIESNITFITCAGKLLRSSKYEEEISDGHLGINEKELNSMNKHIPGNFQLLWRTNRKTVFRGGGHHYKQALLGPLNQTSLWFCSVFPKITINS